MNIGEPLWKSGPLPSLTVACLACGADTPAVLEGDEDGGVWLTPREPWLKCRHASGCTIRGCDSCVVGCALCDRLICRKHATNGPAEERICRTCAEALREQAKEDA
jgi:hypothetical protein